MKSNLIMFGDSHLGRCGRRQISSLESALSGRYDVYNCAADGLNSDDLVNKAAYLAGLKPDVVIISDGTNDCDLSKHVELDRYRANLVKIIDNFAGSQVILLPPIPMDESRLSAEDGKALSNDSLKEYHDAALDVSAQKQIAAIDSWAVYDRLRKNKQDYHEADGLHLNQEGYNVLFDEIAGAIA